MNLCLEVESVKEGVYLSVHHKRSLNQANNQHWILTPEGHIALNNNPKKPYVRVFDDDKETVAQTDFIDNDLNLIWNEIHYLLVKNIGNKFFLNIMNYNAKDKSLGNCHFEVTRDLIKESIQNCIDM
ncbi:22245_t:CDS:2 [Dentiscutata erythropus]|uniref:22245_t:CDS:1 n=1 Tax=Dentiscutata erythropus TaxID=1348616 RepID=A0A9N9AS23_9GLOM|nr:22245_t:CDS:2 [Dentiscutata erythropus]